MSTVLRLNCSIDSEIGRNAAKKFASTLEKAFEQYQKLLTEYLKLLNRYGDANVPSSLDFCQVEGGDKEDIITGFQTCETLAKPFSESQTSQLKKPVSPENKSQSNVSNLGFDSDDDTSMCRNLSTDNDKLLKSPVLGKQQSRSKKSITPNSGKFERNSNNNVNTFTAENISNVKNKFQEDSTKTPKSTSEYSFLKRCDSLEQIDCTPVSKLPTQLKVSKLYNVDTTLLQSGKRLKQAKLVFLPAKQNMDITILEKSDDSQQPKADFHEIEPEDEEIIESSPKYDLPDTKMKSRLKLKRKSPMKSAEKLRTKANKRRCGAPGSDRFVNKTRVPLNEIHESSLNQYSLPLCTSTQIEKPSFVKRSNTHCGLSRDVWNIEQNISGTPPSSPEIKKYTKLDTVKDDIRGDNKEFSDSVAAFTCNDETFFALGENAENGNATGTQNEDCYRKSEFTVPQNVKKSLMTSFDIVPTKTESSCGRKEKSSKSKSERAKMIGNDCYECHEYYSDLGISEEQIKEKLKICSRHRIAQGQCIKQNTPYDFWNPVFDDTQSSTLE